MLNNHIIGVQARRPAANGITIVTPISPQPPSTTLLVNGSYTGAMTSGTLVWRQGGNNVGAPVAIRTIAGGAWSTTITTPAAPGSYTLRAAFNGATPTANSGGVTIEVGAPATVAQFGFVGTNDGDGSVALFAHPFAQGDVQPTDQVLLRRADNNVEVRTQFEPITTWPDGSVRIALMAAELPALADNVAMSFILRRGEAHTSPGPTLTWTSALAGRSIFLRTWAPGNTATPLWSFDVGAALLTSTDNWQVGPLAISRRVTTPVPPSGVLNTSDTAGVITSVRVVCDVTATKDGMLLVDAWFCNDRMLHPGGGTARFGYTIEIDGEIVYNQRPTTGAARDLLQYNWWGVRRAKRETAVYNFVTTFRPTFRPDRELIVRAALRPPVDLQARSVTDPGAGSAADILTSGLPHMTDPWWAWGIMRDAGGTGGRPEIGLSTRMLHGWMFTSSDGRSYELTAHKMAEAFTRAGWLMYDWDLNEPLHPDTWPRWGPGGNAATPGVSTRLNAENLPSSQPRNNNITNHLTHDNAHRGAFYGPLAALSGRRIMFDLLAHRSGEACYSQRSYNGTTFSGGPNWRNMTPDHTTGVAWVPTPWNMQVRSFGWIGRDLSDADYVLPDNYPRRIVYTRNVQAWINVCSHTLPLMASTLGSYSGLSIMHGDSWHRGWMGVFSIYAMVMMLLRGQMTGSQLQVIKEYTRFRATGILAQTQVSRRMLDNDIIYMFSANGFVGPANSWAAVASLPTNPPIPLDWTANTNRGAGSDYNIQAYQGLAMLGTWNADDEARAWAREAMVQLRSYREQPVANFFPRVNPIRVTNSGEPQNTHYFVPQWTYLLNAAPVVTSGQVFSLPTDTPSGSLIGLVEWTGSLPRRGGPEGTGVPAWEIVSQPSGNPFTISDGGVLRLAGTVPFGPTTITVRARCFDANETELASAPTAVTVTGTAIAPNLSSNQSPEVAENTPVDFIAATFTYTGTTGVPSIQSGNTNDLFTVVQVTPTVPGGPNTIQVRVAAPLTGYGSQTRNLVLRVTNPAGFSEAQCNITIVLSVVPPSIPSGQVFEAYIDAPVGASTVPSAVVVNGDPSTKSILIPSGPFAINATTAELTTTGSLGGVNATVFQYTPTIRAQNLGGTADQQVTINVLPPPSVWSSAAPSTIVLEAWSVARRLRNAYTGPLIRVRRASDGAEQDIGILNGVLNESALTSFIGSSQGFIIRVYGQFAGRDLVQTNSSAQYEITNASGAIHRFGGTAVRPTAFTNNSSRVMHASTIAIGGSRSTHALGMVVHPHSMSNFLTLFSAFPPAGSNDSARCQLDPSGSIGTRRVLASTTEAWTPAGTVTTSSRLVAVSFFNAGAGSNSVQMRWNGNSQLITSGPNVTTRFGERDLPTTRYEYGFSVGSTVAGVEATSRPMTWAEAFFVTTTSATAIDAIIAEQRTFYGI